MAILHKFNSCLNPPLQDEILNPFPSIPPMVQLAVMAGMANVLMGYNLSVLNTAMPVITAEFQWCQLPDKEHWEAFNCDTAKPIHGIICTTLIFGAGKYFGPSLCKIISLIISFYRYFTCLNFFSLIPLSLRKFNHKFVDVQNRSSSLSRFRLHRFGSRWRSCIFLSGFLPSTFRQSPHRCFRRDCNCGTRSVYYRNVANATQIVLWVSTCFNSLHTHMFQLPPYTYVLIQTHTNDWYQFRSIPRNLRWSPLEISFSRCSIRSS